MPDQPHNTSGDAPLDAPAIATPLEYDAPRAYHATGNLAVPGLLVALAGGLAAALISALAAWFWLYLKLPSFLVLPMAMQGMVVGIVLAKLFRRARLRNPPLAMALAILCGTFSAGCFQGVVYVRSVYALPRQFQTVLEDRGVHADSPQMMKIMGPIKAHPFDAFDRFVLAPQTKYRGFLGFMMVRETLAWVFTIVQAGIVAFIAVRFGRKSTSHPYCETCGTWYREPFTAALVPAALGDPLALAVEADDPDQVLDVLRLHSGDPGEDLAIVRVYRCPKCQQQMADVILKLFASRQGEKLRLPPHRVSTETVMALRSEAAQPVPDSSGEAQALEGAT